VETATDEHGPPGHASRLPPLAPLRDRDPRLTDWLTAALATPGATALRDPEDAWQVLVEEALVALPFVAEGPVVDVGSGSGSPGLPLAASLPEVQFDLLESSRRKCAFLAAASTAFPNVAVVRSRAEDYGRGAGRDAYAVALARALAPQPIAAEWCLPLVRPGGSLLLFAGAPDPGLDRVAAALAAAPPEVVADTGRPSRVLLIFRKLGPTPDRFPRRPGIARKRPLA
jgi:16S rRNA (guanine527-N7)-methyltransferase